MVGGAGKREPIGVRSIRDSAATARLPDAEEGRRSDALRPLLGTRRDAARGQVGAGAHQASAQAFTIKLAGEQVRVARPTLDAEMNSHGEGAGCFFSFH